MGCLAVVKIIIVLKTDYYTFGIYVLINGLLYEVSYISSYR